MDYNPQTRMTLLERIQNSNDDFSWEEYAHYYQHYIMLLLRRMNVNHHDAEELCQQVLLKSWKSLPTMRLDFSKGRFRSWIAKVTRNTAVDFFRSKAVQKKNMECELNDFLSGHSDEAEIEKKTEKEWAQYLLHMALTNLRDRFSDTVIDAFILSLEGLPHVEIAEKIGVGTDTVKVYKARVKKALAIEILRLNNFL